MGKRQGEWSLVVILGESILFDQGKSLIFCKWIPYTQIQNPFQLPSFLLMDIEDIFCVALSFRPSSGQCYYDANIMDDWFS